MHACRKCHNGRVPRGDEWRRDVPVEPRKDDQRGGPPQEGSEVAGQGDDARGLPSPVILAGPGPGPRGNGP